MKVLKLDPTKSKKGFHYCMREKYFTDYLCLWFLGMYPTCLLMKNNHDFVIYVGICINLTIKWLAN